MFIKLFAIVWRECSSSLHFAFGDSSNHVTFFFSDVFYKQRERILYQMVAEWYSWNETNIFFYINCLLNITFR